MWIACAQASCCAGASAVPVGLVAATVSGAFQAECALEVERAVCGFQSHQMSQAWGAYDVRKQGVLCGCGPTLNDCQGEVWGTGLSLESCFSLWALCGLLNSCVS